MPKGLTTIEPGIQRTAAGNYWLRASVRHPRTGKPVTRSLTLPRGQSLSDARRRLTALRAEVEAKATQAAPTSAPRGRPTVSRCAALWIKGHYDRNRPSTAAHYRQVITDHVLPAPIGPDGTCFGELYVDSVTRADVDSWCRWAEQVRQEDGTPYAADTVKGWWRILCAFLRDIAADHGIADPILRVKGPRIVGRAKRREQRTLTREQLGELVDVVEERWRAEVYLLAYSGMRPGELYALEWGDINEVEGCIHVRRAHKRGHVDATKTDDPRDLGLTPRLRELLEAHRRLSMQIEGEAVALPPALREHLAATGRLVNGDVRRMLGYSARKTYLALQRWCDAGLLVRKGTGTRPWYTAGEALVAGELVPRVPARPLVFPSRLGTYRGPEALLKPLAEAASRAGVGQRVTSQVLRRTFNTLMLKAGVDRTVVRSQMGHCSEAMTSRYAGVTVEDKRSAVTKIEPGGGTPREEQALS